MTDGGLVIDINLSGIEETVANLKVFPVDLEIGLTLAMNKSLPLVEGEVVKRTPKNLGELQGGINHQIITPFPNLVGSVGSPTPYAIVIEKGRKPNSRMPPIAAIAFWLYRKGIVTDRDEIRSVAYAVAKSIAKHGFSPKGNVGPTGARMFEEGFTAAEPHVVRLFNDAVVKATAQAND